MRFVKPESTRYYLDETTKTGDWVELKRELTVGEDKRYRTRGMKGMTGIGGNVKPEDIKVDIEWNDLPFARVEAYLLDWSAGREVTRKAIEALSKEDFEAIDAIVLKHIDLVEESKKAKATTVSATEPQPSLS